MVSKHAFFFKSDLRLRNKSAAPEIDNRFYLFKKTLDSQKKNKTKQAFQRILRATDVNCTAEKIHPSLIFTGLPGQSKKVNDLTYVM